jgi:hypothetical protein
MPLTNQTDDMEELGSSTNNEDPDAATVDVDDATAQTRFHPPRPTKTMKACLVLSAT